MLHCPLMLAVGPGTRHRPSPTRPPGGGLKQKRCFAESGPVGPDYARAWPAPTKQLFCLVGLGLMRRFRRSAPSPLLRSARPLSVGPLGLPPPGGPRSPGRGPPARACAAGSGWPACLGAARGAPPPPGCADRPRAALCPWPMATDRGGDSADRPSLPSAAGLRPWTGQRQHNPHPCEGGACTALRGRREAVMPQEG